MLRVALGIAIFGVALVLDQVVLGRPFLSESAPSFEVLPLLVTLCVAAGSWFLLAPLARSGRAEPGPVISHPWPWRVAGFPFQHQAMAAALAMQVGACLVFLISPWAFTVLAREDRPVEMLSAFAWLAAAALMLIALRRRPALGSLGRLFQLGFAGLAFVIAMEELSWLQRPLGVVTPVGFEANAQGETNLHNFATNLFENIYYSGAFAFFILLPFVGGALRRPLGPVLDRLIPHRWILWSSALLAAYDYDMWVNPLTQLAFFLTLFILLHDLRAHPSRAGLLLLGALVGIQLAFLLRGHGFFRLWDVTEYKEMFIAWSALLYSADVLAQSPRLPPDRHVQLGPS